MIDWNRADDLIPEESELVLLALKRLPPKEAYDRVFRLRRAFQVIMTMLAKDQEDTNRSRSHLVLFGASIAPKRSAN